MEQVYCQNVGQALSLSGQPERLSYVGIAEGDGLVRRHRANGAAEGEREALHRRQADAHAGERAGAARDGEEVDLAAVDAALAQQPVDRRQELLVARAFAFQRDAAEERGVAQQRGGENRKRRVGGEDEHSGHALQVFQLDAELLSGLP